MHPDIARELLRRIDGVEADMRGLETSLTSVRREIFESSGLSERVFRLDGTRLDCEATPAIPTADTEAIVLVDRTIAHWLDARSAISHHIVAVLRKLKRELAGL